MKADEQLSKEISHSQEVLRVYGGKGFSGWSPLERGVLNERRDQGERFPHRADGPLPLI
jgi:hypothetical protein